MRPPPVGTVARPDLSGQRVRSPRLRNPPRGPLLDALPPGRFLVATHATTDFGTPEQQAPYQRLIARGRSDVGTRGRAEFTDLFAGRELVEPGVAPASE